MHGLFGFDPKTLTDEELLERWHALSKKIVWASRFAGIEMVGQLQSLRSQIEFEQRERIVEPRLRARAAMPDVIIETDPDLAAEAKQAQEIALEKVQKRHVRPPIMTRERIAVQPAKNPGNQNK